MGLKVKDGFLDYPCLEEENNVPLLAFWGVSLTIANIRLLCIILENTAELAPGVTCLDVG